VKLVTYNILAQPYVRPERYVGCSADALAAGPRRRRLLARVGGLDADLLALQEVDAPTFAALDAALPHAGAHAPKDGRPDGCAVFSRLPLLAHDVLHYVAHDPGYDHLAQRVVVELGSHRLVLGNTHLRWQRRDTPASSHQGLAQMTELLDWLDGCPGDVHVVVGDLNAEPGALPLRAAESRGYRAIRPVGRVPTALINGNRRCLDHVLVRGPLDALALSPTPVDRRQPIPSTTEPSDHVPVAVRLGM
jgi:mRNA deadenylase 3'-5' endonuclease subunit Ccr4